MANQKPSIPKGTRDFGPVEMAGRNYIFDTVKSVFRKYGYSQIETPSMENLTTLLGKYGDEGDKLLFRVLNSGNAFAGISPEDFADGASLSSRVCEKGLRYDLTVPFARYVVQHQNELVFPFKRFQIQPVWRADRPQKGRYREFYQCDVDVIGSRSMMNELELVQIVDEVFGIMGLDVCIKINNRKVLSGIAEMIGYSDRLVDITVAIDKIDKVGMDAVKSELLSKGLDADAVSKLEPVLALSGTNGERLAAMRNILSCSETGNRGLDELDELLSMISDSGVSQKVELDFSLARGLNYYTGAIFEVKSLDFAIGSICGGGRYDDLTGIFGLPGMSGVGISFGADRIYDVLVATDGFPKDSVSVTDVLFANMGDKEIRYVLPMAASLRKAGFRVEVYPDNVKLKKQFDYADRRKIGFMVIAGDQEVVSGKVNVKNLSTGEQSEVEKGSLVSFFAEKD